MARLLETEEKYEEAIKLYEQLNSPDAQCNLGNLYLKGLGCEKDIKKAVELYKKSAKKNCERAHFNLGLLYADGIGVKKSTTKALEHFKLSVE